MDFLHRGHWKGIGIALGVTFILAVFLSYQMNPSPKLVLEREKGKMLLKEKAPHYFAFGEISCLIQEENYQKALEESVSLKEKMKTSWKFPMEGGRMLYAQTLLRIAFLQKKLGNLPGEKAAWKEIEELEVGPIRDLLYANFKKEQIGLSTYIQERIKQV